MLSNPILQSLKKRCAPPQENNEEGFSSAISVSSHGSGAGTLASTIVPEPCSRPYSQQRTPIRRSSSIPNKPSWIKDDEPTAQYFTEPSHVKKERIRNSVEEWLWELRAPPDSDLSAKEDLSMNSLLNNGTQDSTNNKTLVNFDISTKDLMDLKSSFTAVGSRPSTPFPDPWATNPLVSDPLGIPASRDDTLMNQPAKEDISPSFQNFLNQYKSAAVSTDVFPTTTDPIKIGIPESTKIGGDYVSASCPTGLTDIDCLYPRIQDIKCDISARSSRSFWLEKLANYHKIIGEKVAEETEQKNFESDLIGTENNPGEDSALLLNGGGACAQPIPTEEFEDELEGDRAFDRAFLSVIVDEDESEGKLSEESSGYAGSASHEDTAKANTAINNRKRSIQRKKSVASINLKEDMEMLMMATKLYRQSSAGRRRRCTSTPLSSPEKPDFFKTPKLLSEILPAFPRDPMKLQ